MDTQYLLRQFLTDKDVQVVIGPNDLDRISKITATQIQVFILVGDGWFSRQKQELELVEDLTRQETVVLRLLADGLNNNEITERLTVSRNTVKSHVSSILGKLGVSDRTKAAVWAVRNLDYEFEHKAAA